MCCCHLSKGRKGDKKMATLQIIKVFRHMNLITTFVLRPSCFYHGSTMGSSCFNFTFVS